jgi:hypothetical protein
MVQHRLALSVPALALSSLGVAGLVYAPAATTDDRTATPMPGVFRRCDHSADTFYPSRGDGRAIAFIGAGQQNSVTADVQLFTAVPNTHYIVRLIQTPRPSLTCAPGDPGVAEAALDTDAVGAATVSVQATALPGTTGAWVIVDRPAEFSQTPAEFYTSDFIADV